MIAYRRHGSGADSKRVAVGKVTRNDREGQAVIVHAYTSRWQGVRVTHRAEYLDRDGVATTDPTPKQREELVRYGAIVLLVELLAGGEMIHSSLRTLQSSQG